MCEQYFNSSKVRLEVLLRIYVVAEDSGISIPLRCDWKEESKRTVSFMTDISIPLRCDWKRRWNIASSFNCVFQFL